MPKGAQRTPPVVENLGKIPDRWIRNPLSIRRDSPSGKFFTTLRGVYNFGLTRPPTPSLRPREPQPMKPQPMGGKPREP